MKSRVINTKHFEQQNNQYIGYTSKLKPSLFYGNKEIEGYLFVQDFETNKMSKWLLTDEKLDGKKIIWWCYQPCEKDIKKNPSLHGKKLVIYFDSRKIKELAYRKYKRISSEY